VWRQPMWLCLWRCVLRTTLPYGIQYPRRDLLNQGHLVVDFDLDCITLHLSGIHPRDPTGTFPFTSSTPCIIYARPDSKTHQAQHTQENSTLSLSHTIPDLLSS
jgi:hypothetical protein